MSKPTEPSNFLAQLSEVIYQIKSQNPAVNEDFDLELFSLGYLTALQTLSGVDRFHENLNDLLSLRNLESKGKVSKMEKYSYLSNILLLTHEFENKRNQLSRFKVLPQSKREDFLPKIPLRHKPETDSSEYTLSKRSKSNESRQRLLVSPMIADRQSEECFLCLQEMKNFNQIKLDACNHSFHKKCLQTYLNEEFENKKFPLLCPLASCHKEIEPQILPQKFNLKVIHKFWNYAFELSLSFSNNIYSWCPSYGCKYFYVAHSPLLMLFPCPICTKTWCLNCRAEYHRGKTCAVYQKEKGLKIANVSYPDNIIRFKACPQCQCWNKYTGDLSTKCIQCNTNFLFIVENLASDEFSEANSEQGETELHKMILRDQKEESAKIGGKNNNLPDTHEEEQKTSVSNFFKIK